MSDLLKVVLKQVTEALGEVKALVEPGVETLRGSEELVRRCLDLRNELVAALNADPPLKPFLIPVKLMLPDRRVVPAPRRKDYRREDIDRNHCVVREIETDLDIPSGQLAWADGSATPELRILVRVYYRHHDPDGEFHWQERIEERQVPLTREMLPPEKGLLRNLSLLYRRREAELTRDVLEIRNYTAEKDREIRELNEQVKELYKLTEELEAQVAALPSPRDAVAQLTAIATSIDAIRNTADAANAAVVASRQRLETLRNNARAILPE